eukprot:CAMPEP_0172872620 /NCGR_PEP_ID=MMETSP1075-20121228/92733_1 /TAXON_ID=2916 /ORGANISM="Ceratium fusus, Strain PA161109" /LENGTH=37 /DNA_ID= /DNA_START= /DNA_END= /DNA_ORIENTATION=
MRCQNSLFSRHLPDWIIGWNGFLFEDVEPGTETALAK